MMLIRVRLFAITAEITGVDVIEVTLDDHAAIRDLRGELGRLVPRLLPYLPQMMFAVNSEYATDASVIPANAEVACIPPVSGG